LVLKPQDWVNNTALETPERSLFSNSERLVDAISQGGITDGFTLPLPKEMKRGSPMHCSVCMDTIETGYDGDLDEWVVKGAVLENGKYYHSKCWDEVASRVRHIA
jgi:hypothetical protein